MRLQLALPEGPLVPIVQFSAFTYFCNEEQSIGAEELGLLDAVGFDVDSEVVHVPTPDDCQYWRAKSIVAPRCVKRGDAGDKSSERPG